MLRSFGDRIIEFPLWMIIAGAFFTAFVISWVAIPSIVKVSELKGLFDEPNHRTSHTRKVPTLGGSAIFMGLIITISVFSGPGIDHELKYIIASMLILFFIGIKDDVLIIDPKKKLLSQFIAAAIVAILGNIRITSFQGFLGIGEISYLASILFTIFVVIVVINGVNLIDGIDGLASGVGIVVGLFYATWFIFSRYTSYGVLSIALVGSLLAFFYFNVFGKANKIFLGDTGSLIIGLILAILTVRFLEYNITATGKLHINSAPVVAFGILIVPLFDTLRVILIRLFQGKSPFKADKQHVHHRLLQLGNSHLKATTIILVTNLLFIMFGLVFQGIRSVSLIFIEIFLATILSFLPVIILNRKSRERSDFS
ncbi:MAG: MraY family glycosyltransferase [Bacteroidota bacterium]